MSVLGFFVLRQGLTMCSLAGLELTGTPSVSVSSVLGLKACVLLC